ncbi:MAG TPA: hypothetical protein VG796_02805 [Verrucomicrobiales bacterium]|nr:hypothetical protein [Verrucomicrobiales bacterium]
MDDDDISLLLAEPDVASRQAAFDAAVLRYWKQLRAFLHTSMGMRDPDDQGNVISKTFLKLHSYAVATHEFHLDGPPVIALLRQIARNTALDLYRSRRAEMRGAAAYEDYVLNEILPLLRQEGVSSEWQQLSSRGATAEIMDRFREAVCNLPPQQDAAARAVAMLCDSHSQLNNENIRDAMQAITGKPVTLPAAKSAWNAVRAKMRAVLDEFRR